MVSLRSTLIAPSIYRPTMKVNIDIIKHFRMSIIIDILLFSSEINFKKSFKSKYI